MIVTDKQMQAGVDYRMQNPHPIGLARLDLENAKNRAKEAYARAYLKAEGTIKDRECAAEIDPDHVAAKDELAKVQAEYEAEREKVERCVMLSDIWRSDRAHERELGKFR